MPGMDRNSGRALDGWPHVLQSLMDIWTTPRKSRVLQRDYGSGIPDLIDRPGNRDVLLELVLAIGDAEDWEPRFRLTRARLIEGGPDGVFEFEIFGYHFPNGHKGDYSVVELVHDQRVRIVR